MATLMHDESLVQPADTSVGLIAGWGRFPVLVAESLADRGHSVHCIAINGHADKAIEKACKTVCWSGVGRMGAHVRYFRRHGCAHVTMAGKLFKSDLLYQASIWRHLPDWTCLKTFAPLLVGRNRDARDDSLLAAVTQLYDQSGMPVCAATDYAPELLVSEGHLAGPSPKRNVQRDVDLGWQVAKQMGELDIGQSITIKDGTVIAVEAIEGTDACIQRSGELCSRGGWTLVKVAKPDQDMRFDVPTIGPKTIQNVHDHGGKAIVIEADMTIVVDQAATYELAKRLGVSLFAIRPSGLISNLRKRAA
ncbi:MAG: UDP-2,3-diacylglucosamine diphosphatase LpxI [Planctomycetota bacterium]